MRSSFLTALGAPADGAFLHSNPSPRVRAGIGRNSRGRAPLMNHHGPMLDTFTGGAVKKSVMIVACRINSLVLQLAQAVCWRMLPGLGGIFTFGALDHHGSPVDPARG